MESGTAPFTVKFDDNFQGLLASAKWDFGDGATSREHSQAHVFATAGTHTINLTVSGLGEADPRVLPDLVTVEPGSLANVVIEPTEVTLDIGAMQPFTFEAVDIDSFGGFMSQDGVDFAPLLGSTIDDSVLMSFFTLAPSVTSRYIAYYFGDGVDSYCGNGPKINEEYATGVAE